MNDLGWRPAKRPDRIPLTGDSVLLEPLEVARHGEELYASTAGADSTWDYLPYGPFAGKGDFMAWLEQRAPERFGFTFEGVFRHHMVVKGRNRDTAWYSITDSEWPARRAAFEAWLAPANFDPSGVQRRSLAEMRGGIEVSLDR